MTASLRAGLVGGALATILTVTFALSYAVLIFNGDLAAGLSFGITASLVAAAVASIALVCFGTMRFQIGTPTGNTVAVVAVAAAAIDRSLPGASHAAAIPTVLVAIAISTIVVGIMLFALGALGAGRWMRFIPYPVIGGVLGAAGWLFVVGSFRVMGTGQREQIIVGLAFSLVVIVTTMRIKHALLLPGLLTVGIAAFYAFVAVRGISLEALRSAGWFLNVPHGSPFASPWANLHAVAWGALSERIGDLLTLLVVSALTLLLGVSGVELGTNEEAELDHEMRIQGAANVACGLLGGVVGLGALTNTLVSYGIAGRSRIPPLVVAAASIGILFGGSSIVEAIPRFIFGALIFTTGVSLLYEWCVRSARRLPIADYLSILAIVAVVVRFGYVSGVLTGIVIGCIMFVVSYSRVRVIKHDLSADVFRSSVLRSLAERELLQTHGKAIRILVLQGFIFFGMADRLYRTIKALLEAPGQHPDFLILDFHGVHGLDSSAASSFSKIQQLATRDQSRLIISAIAPELEKQWKFGGDGQHGVLEFRDLDAALEFCEGELLRKRIQHLGDDATLEQWLSLELGDLALARRLEGFLEKRKLAGGDVLCEQGTVADEMYFIEEGRVGVTIGAGDEMVRLRSLGERTILGEMGLYRERMRSASVVAEQPSTVYVLSRDSFNTMEKTDPVLAAAFNAAIVRTLADRLEFESAMVASLQR